MIEIMYTLSVKDGRRYTFEVTLDPKTLEQEIPATDSLPEWVALDVEQCKSCPLRKEHAPQCPAARSIAVILPEAAELMSYTEVDAEVKMGGRTVQASVPIQNALSSIIGLCMATSGCPNLAFLKPMARFHTPFATMDETVFRAIGSYLVGQYLRRLQSGESDFSLDGLEEAYRRLHQVNVGMANRLRHVGAGDAKLNAIVRLDMFTHELPYRIREELVELEPYFRDYLDGAGEIRADE